VQEQARFGFPCIVVPSLPSLFLQSTKDLPKQQAEQGSQRHSRHAAAPWRFAGFVEHTAQQEQRATNNTTSAV